MRVDRDIGNVPVLGILFLTPLHALCDSVLVRAAERRENKLTAVRHALVDVHSGEPLVDGSQLRQIAEIEVRLHAVGVHIERNGDDIDITGAFAVAEKSTLNAVSAREQSKFGVRDTAAAVVMRVEGDFKGIPAVQYLAHIFYLLCVNMRKAFLNGDGQIDDYLQVGSRLPDVDNGVAYLCCELRLGSGEALRGILKSEIARGLLAVFVQQLSAGNCDVDYLLLALAENLLALCNGGRVVQMNDSVLAAVKRLESLLDDVFAALGQHLNGNIVGDKILLDKRAAELVFSLGSGGEAYLYLLESDLDQLLEELQLFIKAHRNDKRLVAVAQIDAAPLGGFLDVVLFSPVHASERRHEISSCVLACVCHISFLSGRSPARTRYNTANC